MAEAPSDTFEQSNTFRWSTNELGFGSASATASRSFVALWYSCAVGHSRAFSTALRYQRAIALRVRSRPNFS